MSEEKNDLAEVARVILAPVLAWIDEPAEPLERLRRADATYAAVEELVRDLGANGRRGQAARDLIRVYGLKGAAAMAGYSETTMRRVAWK